jgi:hypothetical protein
LYSACLYGSTALWTLLLLLVGWDWVHLVLWPQLAYCTNSRW